MKFKICLLLILSLVFAANAGFCEDPQVAGTVLPEPAIDTAASFTGKVLFGFEEAMPSWEIPEWCFEKEEYVGESIAISSKYAKEGNSSLELMTNFPGAKWTATYIEVQQYFDWTPYKTLSVDLYLPKEAPFGLQARFIITGGENWTWIEMARLIKLVPGEWVTLTASLAPGSTDWRKTQVTDEFRADVRKLGVRVESNMRPTYSGPIYFDNVRVE